MRPPKNAVIRPGGGYRSAIRVWGPHEVQEAVVDGVVVMYRGRVRNRKTGRLNWLSWRRFDPEEFRRRRTRILDYSRKVKAYGG